MERVFQPPPAQTMVQALELLFALGGKTSLSFPITDFVKLLLAFIKTCFSKCVFFAPPGGPRRYCRQDAKGVQQIKKLFSDYFEMTIIINTYIYVFMFKKEKKNPPGI